MIFFNICTNFVWDGSYWYEDLYSRTDLYDWLIGLLFHERKQETHSYPNVILFKAN